MKIVAVIAEYNPFHNGHLYQLNKIRQEFNADKILVIMSGNFTQRGENAVMDKFTRARHAIFAGADIVIELPAIFSVANAEIFASGAVKILKDLNVVDSLCFGVENGTAEEFLNAGQIMLKESKELKSLIKKELETGVSPVKARYNAIKKANLTGFDEKLIATPNNILALEYAKAVIKTGANFNLLPIVRDNIHNDTRLKKGITSATSIRASLQKKKTGALKKCMPKFVYKDLPKTPYDFSEILMAKLYTEDAENLAQILDCTEGLENRIKALIKDNINYGSALEKISTKRYTLARIRRIIVSNLLGIKEKLVFKALDTSLYAKVLAVSENSKDLISLLNEKSDIKILTRKKDFAEVKKQAQEVLNIDVLANDLYNLTSKNRTNEYFTEIVKV